MIYERFGDLIVGEGAEDVVDALVRELSRTGSTIATAESCTGGLVAQMITAIPGVSPHYPGGLVTYSAEAKTNLLDVPGRPDRIDTGRSAPRWPARWPGESASDSGPTSASPSPGSPGRTTDDPRHPVGLVYLGLATPTRSRPASSNSAPSSPAT